ncbi:hypothetical protein [Bacillus tuaregi]|uniref:hypothetical protein n=1 Tax=Bacillus tuaregi TaxID=1816695 RepID=UPI0008F8F51F|nr:hypothetical protein [Bacillus tuaregi]
MFDSFKLFYQLNRGLTDFQAGPQKFASMFTMNQPYMRWTEDWYKLVQSGGWWGISAEEYWRVFTSYAEVFQRTTLDYPVSTMNVYQRWFESFFDSYQTALQGYKQEPTEQVSQAKRKNYPPDWSEEKEALLIQSVIKGTKEAKTLSSIFEQVGERIGLTPAKCSNYWYTKVDQRYRDQVNQIKQELASNWTEEEEELLTKIVTEEYPHLSIYQTFPIASKRLKRHSSDVQRKWFSLLTRN